MNATIFRGDYPAIFEYIEAFYNRVRRHSELGHSSHIEHRKKRESATVVA